MGIKQSINIQLDKVFLVQKLIWICISIFAIFFILDIFLVIISQKPYFTQNFTPSFIVGAFSSFLISFIFLGEYFKSNADIKFSKSFGKLIGEIRYNHSMAGSFCLNDYIKQARNNWLNHNVYWIPEKHPSFTPWSNFFYYYLPVNAYYYFINQEFIIENRLDLGLSDAVGSYYIACINFSQSTQQIEDYINQNLFSLTPEQIEQSCASLHRLAELHLPEIDRKFNSIMNTEMVKKFVSLHPEMITYE